MDSVASVSGCFGGDEGDVVVFVVEVEVEIEVGELHESRREIWVRGLWRRDFVGVEDEDEDGDF